MIQGKRKEGSDGDGKEKEGREGGRKKKMGVFFFFFFKLEADLRKL
jgi:hypothetical protein